MARSGSARASRYRRISVGWTDDARLRSVSDQAFRAYWALRCGPGMGPAIGLCRAGAGQLADLLRWDYQRADDALRELHIAGVLQHDRDAGLVYFPGAVTESPPPNLNSLKAALSEVASMPGSQLKGLILDELREAAGDGAGMAGLFEGGAQDSDSAAAAQPHQDGSATTAQPLHNHSATVVQPLRNDSATTANNQDQDQDQDQDQEQGARARARDPEPPPIVAGAPPEIRRDRLATKPQRQLAAEILAENGLTVAAWLQAAGHDALMHSHIDEIKAQYRGRQGEQERERAETQRRNEQLRALKRELRDGYAADPTRNWRQWIGEQPERLRFSLRATLQEMDGSAQEGGHAAASHA